MMDFLKENFEALRKGELKEAIEALERTFRKFGVDSYLIGAFARDVWINHLELKGKRTTTDIDFSVYVNEHKQFETIKVHLVEVEGFTQDKKQPYRLYSRQGQIVDLIPFGGIEQNNEVFLKGNPPVEISVFGTKEVTAHAEVVEGDFKVVTLPGLSILKLIAWRENPGARAKDLDDFYFLLKNYFDIAGDLIYENADDELTGYGYQIDFAAARLLGRQMKAIIGSNKKLLEKIMEILNSRLDKFTERDIEEMYNSAEEHDEIITRYRMIIEVIKGVKD